MLRNTPMPQPPYNVIFVCTGNSARSILAEGILNGLGGGRFRAFSAGSQPTGKVQPLALEELVAHGLPVQGARSKSWDEFARQDAPAMDFVFTVCDSAAAEACPLWPAPAGSDGPVTAHWGVADPAAVQGDEEVRGAAFAAAYAALRKRIERFIALPLERLDRDELKARLVAIGEL
jgi:arsenate reductase